MQWKPETSQAGNIQVHECRGYSQVDMVTLTSDGRQDLSLSTNSSVWPGRKAGEREGWLATHSPVAVGCCFIIQLLSRVWLFVTPWIVIHQTSLSMRFPGQEYWNGLPFPSSGDLPHPGIKPVSPSLPGRLFTMKPQGSLLQITSTYYIKGFSQYILPPKAYGLKRKSVFLYR